MKIKLVSLIIFSLLAALPYSSKALASCDLSTIDWSQWETVDVDMYSFHFDPDYLNFKACKPYKLVLTNEADITHSFSADNFFATVLVKKDGGEPAAISDEDKAALDLAPQGEAALLFIATTPGDYDFQCSHPFHAGLGMKGKITVD